MRKVRFAVRKNATSAGCAGIARIFCLGAASLADAPPRWEDIGPGRKLLTRGAVTEPIRPGSTIIAFSPRVVSFCPAPQAEEFARCA